MRLPRFFAKKRGHRQTGSGVWGSVGEALFHAALIVTGLAFGGLLVTGVAVPEWRINHDFLPAEGVVVGKGLARRESRRGSGLETSWQPCLRMRYADSAGVRESWAVRGPADSRRLAALRRLDEITLGEEMACWFDPQDPETVVLERGYNWWMWMLTLLLPGALLAFGSAGLWRFLLRWGKSEERQAAARRISDPLAGKPTGERHFPGIPPCDDLVNSPGTMLRFRLPGFGLFAVLWNVVLALLAVNAGLDLLGGRADWLLLVVLVPFAVVGGIGIVVFVRRLVLTTAVGPTQLEISDHPLRPGQRYEVLLGQGGTGGFRALEPSESGSGRHRSVPGTVCNLRRARDSRRGPCSKCLRRRCTPSSRSTTPFTGAWSSAAALPAGRRSPARSR